MKFKLSFFDQVNNIKQVLILKKIDFSARRYRWRLLKGGVQDGETEAEALHREVSEETGLKNVKILDKVHSYQFVFKDVRHVVSSYLVKADLKEPIKLQEAEVADYLWTTKENGLKLLYWINEKEPVKQLK